MVYSMTGFGRGGVQVGSATISAEVKSVNNRFCEVFVKMPVRFTNQEEQIKEKIKEGLKRGKIDVLIDITGEKKGKECINIDESKLAGYFAVVRDIKKKFDIKGDITIQDILRLDDIFIKKEEEDIVAIYWDAIMKAVQKALVNVNKSRKAEGKNLEVDLRKRIGIIKNNLSSIEKAAQERSKMVQERLYKKTSALLDRVDKINNERLELEILLLSEKYDITEECVRLKHHNSFFLETLKGSEESGKKLEFILQEMTREVNTIGSKGNLFEISKYVVSIKEEIEKLREQVRNVL